MSLQTTAVSSLKVFCVHIQFSWDRITNKLETSAFVLLIDFVRTHHQEQLLGNAQGHNDECTGCLYNCHEKGGVWRPKYKLNNPKLVAWYQQIQRSYKRLTKKCFSQVLRARKARFFTATTHQQRTSAWRGKQHAVQHTDSSQSDRSLWCEPQRTTTSSWFGGQSYRAKRWKTKYELLTV